jgi:hypothetical protein
VRSIIVEDELDATLDAGVIQGHFPMFVPAFDDPRIDRGKVNLSELQEVRLGALQHMKNGPTLIGDAL